MPKYPRAFSLPLVIATGLVLGLSLVGCGQLDSGEDCQAAPRPSACAEDEVPTEGTSPDLNEYPGLMIEMDEWEAKTSRPEGTSIVRPVDVGPYPVDDKGTMGVDRFEVGHGRVLVEEGSFCLWLGSWLTNRAVDEEAGRMALTEMLKFPETWTFVETYDPASTQPYLEGVLQKAELGDPTGGGNYWQMNCVDYHDQYPSAG